jgi:hypothetical protein
VKPLLTSPSLFRGDSLPNSSKDHSSQKEKGRTWAEYYKTEGLMAKFNSGGSSSFWKKSLAYLVASHVGYKRHSDPKKVTPEQFISNKSPFISFSSDIDKAGYFMDRTEKAKLVQSELGEATHFQWSLIPIECVKNGQGWFSFIYSASIENVAQFLRQDMSALQTRGHKMDIGELGLLLGGMIVSANTLQNHEPHYADLIDVATFLKNTDLEKIDSSLVNRAIQRAEEASEWLLFPKDSFDGPGYSSRFILNKYLRLHYWAKKLKKQ